MLAAPLTAAKPAEVAQELLRLSLLARLALQLDDQPLARCAARYAAPLVRLLAGLDDGQADEGDELPELEDLLERLRPAAAQPLSENEP